MPGNNVVSGIDNPKEAIRSTLSLDKSKIKLPSDIVNRGIRQMEKSEDIKRSSDDSSALTDHEMSVRIATVNKQGTSRDIHPESKIGISSSQDSTEDIGFNKVLPINTQPVVLNESENRHIKNDKHEIKKSQKTKYDDTIADEKSKQKKPNRSRSMGSAPEDIENDNDWRTLDPEVIEVIQSIIPIPDELTTDVEIDTKEYEEIYGRSIVIKSASSTLHQAQRSQRKKSRSGHRRTSHFHHDRVIMDIEVGDSISIQDLASKMAVKNGDVLKSLMKLGIVSSLNRSIDGDTAELIASEYGHRIKRISDSDIEKRIVETKDSHSLEARPPVVTIMGHVDHGKTSLLDAIRKSNVVSGESGGITQHIGAYTVKAKDDKLITFIDTPGHEAFTAMRSRGAIVTDIVVIVVAADDGIMPQTVESINHAKSANATIIVAINKIDKLGADPEKIINEMMQYELVPEKYGGNVIMVEVSAKTGANLDKLLEAIILQAEMLELKARRLGRAIGTVIDARVQRDRGVIVTILVQHGVLKIGDIIVCGTSCGRVRNMINDVGLQIKEAGPSIPVQILGLGSVPMAGDNAAVVKSDSDMKELVDYRKSIIAHNANLVTMQKNDTNNIDDIFAKFEIDKKKKDVNFIIKADTPGSLEAILSIIGAIHHDEINVNIISSSIGAVSESDIDIAKVSSCIVLGFNVKSDTKIQRIADEFGVKIKHHSIIYNLERDVKDRCSEFLAPILTEEITGTIEVRDVFNSSKSGVVVGGYVTGGEISVGSNARIIRGKNAVHSCKIGSLRRFKDEVKEVKLGYECGVNVVGCADILKGDIFEVYVVTEKKALIR